METAAEPPASLGKALVACLVCKLVKTLDQFHRDGCDNCYFLDMMENRNRCEDCTTINFQGIITVVDPKASWAAKWLHMVRGDLSNEVEDILRENNRTRNISNS